MSPYRQPPTDWTTYPCLRCSTVSKILDCSPRTVRDMIHDGRLRAFSITPKGRETYRVCTRSLLAFMAGQFIAHEEKQAKLHA